MTDEQFNKKLHRYDKVYPYELWDLSIVFAHFILPRLKAHKENSISFPGFNYETKKEMKFKEWKIIMDKMIKAFELLCEDMFDYIDKHKKITKSKKNDKEIFNMLFKRRQKYIDRGLKLFIMYFQNLWD